MSKQSEDFDMISEDGNNQLVQINQIEVKNKSFSNKLNNKQ